MQKVNSRVMRAIRNSKGRFFGLYTIQGESLNVRLTGETKNYVSVFDTNAKVGRKFAKSSICGVRLAKTNFGKVVSS